MQEPNIKNVQDLLQQNREVNNLSRQAGQLQALQRALCLVLPTMLTDYCRVRRFDGRTLYLDVATGAVATQLRFIQPQLVPKLRNISLFTTLDHINVRVHNPATSTRKKQQRKAKAVSAENCQLLEDTACGIDDTALAESLRTLASTLKGL